MGNVQQPPSDYWTHGKPVPKGQATSNPGSALQTFAKTLRPDPALPCDVVAGPTCQTCGDVRWVMHRAEGQPSRMVVCPACAAKGQHPALQSCRDVGAQIGGLSDAAPRTFESFVELDASVDPEGRTSVMLQAANRFAEQPKGWLIFHGKSTVYGRTTSTTEYGRTTSSADMRCGTGKSHLAEAITRYRLDLGEPWLYAKAPDLLVWLGACKRTDDDPDFEQRLKWVIGLPGLVIDELGVESGSEFAERVLYRLLDARWDAADRGLGGATVLTSNVDPRYWADARLSSRALDASFIRVPVGTTDVRQVER